MCVFVFVRVKQDSHFISAKLFLRQGPLDDDEKNWMLTEL